MYIDSVDAQYNLGVPASKAYARRAVFYIENSRIASSEDDDVLPTLCYREISV